MYCETSLLVLENILAVIKKKDWGFLHYYLFEVKVHLNNVSSIYCVLIQCYLLGVKFFFVCLFVLKIDLFEGSERRAQSCIYWFTFSMATVASLDQAEARSFICISYMDAGALLSQAC